MTARWAMFISLVALTACVHAPTETHLGIVGPHATDCGTVSLQGDREPVDRCTVKEFEAGKEFFAYFEKPGMDSKIWTLFISTKEKAIRTFQVDQSISCLLGPCEVLVFKKECRYPKVSMVFQFPRIICRGRP